MKRVAPISSMSFLPLDRLLLQRTELSCIRWAMDSLSAARIILGLQPSTCALSGEDHHSRVMNEINSVQL
jgi:hypothetical protein